MSETTVIKVLDDGPFLVTGEVSLTDADKEEFISEQEPIALCRCGSSDNKPFCDGVHSKIAFKAAQRAMKESESEE